MKEYIEIIQDEILGITTQNEKYYKNCLISGLLIDIKKIIFDGENYLIVLEDNTGIQIHTDWVISVHYRLRILTDKGN